MTSEKLREEFEAAMPVPEGVHWDADRNQYMTSTHHVPCVEYRGAWKGWQASRKALVIELPDEEPGYMYYAPDVVAAIEAAGVQIAEPEADDPKSSQEILSRVQSGQEAVYSAVDVRKSLGLDDEVKS